MTDVQHLAAVGAPAWTLPWPAARLPDPMVSLMLLATLHAEETTARYQVSTDGWLRGAKWFTLATTYTWAAYVNDSATVVVLHSVPPLVVLVAAQAISALREQLAGAAGTSVNDVFAEPHGRTAAADSLTVARAALTPYTAVTPAWIREVIGCARGLSSRPAVELRTEVQS